MLFNPYELKNTVLRNRIVMAPMTRSMSPGGVPTQAVIDYYERRAKAEVGLIITEGIEVSHKASSAYPDVPRLDSEEARNAWRKVVTGIKKHDGAVVAQLWHCGGFRKLGMAPEPEVPGHTASGLVRPGKKVAHEMTIQDINETIQAFASDAKFCEEIGFDGVEIHGAHGYLIDNFFWHGTNVRKDMYGGSTEERSQLATEIVKAIRSEVSSNFIVGLRFSQWKQQDYEAKITSDKDELNLFLNILKDAGADFLHCSNRRFWEGEFSEDGLNLAGIAKKTTGLPSISVGSVGVDKDFIKLYAGDHQTQTTDLDKLHERLNKSEFDLIAVGRALLSDPEWANKVQNGQEKDIIPFDKSFVENYV